MVFGREALEEKKSSATRAHLIAAAFDLLVERPGTPFSHEAVAQAAGVGARTVYRYFPAQSDLYEALWRKLREESETIFPAAEEEIVPALAAMYRAFDRNERLVRAVMESPAGVRVRAQGAAENKASFDQSLQNLLQGRTASDRRKARAIFQSLHSAAFWQMLHDRGELSSAEAIEAACWAAQTLLDALRRETAGSPTAAKSKRTRGA